MTEKEQSRKPLIELVRELGTKTTDEEALPIMDQINARIAEYTQQRGITMSTPYTLDEFRKKIKFGAQTQNADNNKD